jgi:hypothetical protein
MFTCPICHKDPSPKEFAYTDDNGFISGFACECNTLQIIDEIISFGVHGDLCLTYDKIIKLPGYHERGIGYKTDLSLSEVRSIISRIIEKKLINSVLQK